MFFNSTKRSEMEISDTNGGLATFSYLHWWREGYMKQMGQKPCQAGRADLDLRDQ